MQELDDIERTFQEVDTSSFNYKIEATFPTTDHFVNITGMFQTPKELREVGIPSSKRRVIAKNIDGYEELRDLGFKDKEIIKAY
jgi:hypothetical protein